MKIVIFGLTISSSWGNGHATLWRGLCKALVRRNHSIFFFERDVPYYASHRDFFEVPGNGRLRLYERFEDITMEAKACLQDADLAMTTSYCPDARAATELLLNANTGIRAFYDLDTPITLETLRSGTIPSYIPEQGLGDFDLVLSYTGGQALTELQNKLSAKRVAPLFGSVDPDLHFPV